MKLSTWPHGFTIHSSEPHGPAKTKSFQVRSNSRIIKTYRYDVSNRLSKQEALESALKFVTTNSEYDLQD